MSYYVVFDECDSSFSVVDEYDSIVNEGLTSEHEAQQTIYEIENESLAEKEEEKRGMVRQTLIANQPKNSLILKDNTFFEIDQELFDTFQSFYPNVNLQEELTKMAAWLFANDARRKTRRGMKRFINSWLSRASQSPYPPQNQLQAAAQINPFTGKPARSTRERTLTDDLTDRSWAAM